ncbi:MAG: S9 family peptidase [Rhizomicrobium sp.]|nr:S9 family peptidase [Rhizomicrobium sp.]
MKVWMSSAAFCAVIAAASLAQSPAKPPIEAFATLPTASSPSLSPDGSHLALIQVYSGRPVAAIWKLGETKPQLVIPYNDGFIVGAVWANNHRILITVNMNARVLGDDVNPWFRTVSIDTDSRETANMFSDQVEARDYNYSASNVVDLAANDPDHIYMSLYAGAGMVAGDYEKPRNTIFRVDINTGRSRYVERGGRHTVDWVMDGNGAIVARQDQTENPLLDHILVYSPDKDWREIATTDASGGHGYGIYGLSEDGKALAISTDSSSAETRGLSQMSLADGKVSELFFNPKFDVSSALTEPWSGRVIGASFTTHLPHFHYFSAPLQAMQSELESNFPGNSVHALTWDLARKKVMFSVDGPVTPPTFYLSDLENHTVQRVARSYPALPASDLGQIRFYAYAARDGLEIPAYLTLPPGKEAKNLPVVILPHGGPRARDDMAFDWESQFLASRGYAVLRPNFRGSWGYGVKFLEAGYGQWGRKMQDDVTDGVQKLIADGIADPKRICIVGGSYGGYAALAGAAFTPDLYACAAAWAPVTDLHRLGREDLHDSGGNEHSAAMSAWSRFIGPLDDKAFDAHSPALHADAIKIPILLMHGEDDYTVRIEQSEEMDRALRNAHKNVTFVRIPKETHHMQTMAARVRWLTELEKFLKENIGD